MHFKGVVKKMITEYSSEVNYFIEFENSFIHLNQFLEKLFTIECIGYSCLSCTSNQEIFLSRCFNLTKTDLILCKQDKGHLSTLLNESVCYTFLVLFDYYFDFILILSQIKLLFEPEENNVQLMQL